MWWRATHDHEAVYHPQPAAVYEPCRQTARVYAEYTDNPLEKAAYAARASIYDIMADDMREILEDADDIN